MRFAYIDSQGKEVPIPSVEALQLRIELGAVSASTMFFDGGSGRWAPAKDHEIFRTLSRELQEDDGSVPEVRGQRREPPAGSAGASTEAPDDAGAFDLSELDFSAFDEPEPDPADEPAPVDWAELREEDHLEEPSDEDVFLQGAELQLEEPLDRGAEDPPGAGVAASPPGWLEEGPGEGEALDEAGPDGEPGLEEDAAEDNDFGGSDGGLQLEEAWQAGASQPASEPGRDAEASEQSEQGGGQERPERARAGGQEQPEEADRQQTASGAVPSAERSGHTETRTGGARTADGAPPAPPRSRPAPPRRSPPSRRRKAGPGRAVAGALLAVVLLVGGWFGWQALSGNGSLEGREAAVVVPELPTELETLHQEAVPGAVEAMVESLRNGQEALPEAPQDDWLGGEYLASASSFPEVEGYWNDLQTFLEDVRSREAEAFADAYAEELEELPVPGPTSRERLVERAEAGFRASRAERAQAYDRLAALVDASLELHHFLLSNEERITYEPTGGGFSRDPVTEAIPATPELGEEMWTRVSGITAAMDALGAVDRLTTERLLGIVFERIAATPVE